MTQRTPPDPSALWARMQDRIDKGGACWLWQGARTSNGYGRVHWMYRPYRVHRVAYLAHRGSIPNDMVIDHLCRVRHCVNPDHLEVVTDRVNILRGASPSAENATKTHCKRGHEFDAANTYIRSTGVRECRKCHQIGKIRRKARTRDMRAA